MEKDMVEHSRIWISHLGVSAPWGARPLSWTWWVPSRKRRRRNSVLVPALRAQIKVLASFCRNFYLTHIRSHQREAPLNNAIRNGEGGKAADDLSTGFWQDSGFACNSFENIANRLGGVGHLVANGISSTGYLVTNGIGGVGYLVANGISGTGDLVTEITSGVHDLGLNLLGIPLGFEKGVIGELTGGRLQLAFGVLGDGVDLVVDAHGDAAREREKMNPSLSQS